MLEKRRTGHILLLINLSLVLFVIIRSGSSNVDPRARATEPMTISILEQPPRENPDTLLLIDFEKSNDLMNMYDQGGEYSLSISGEHATRGQSTLLIDKDPESNMELAAVHFPRHWKGYDVLELDIYNDSDLDGTLWLRMGSQYDSRRFYVKSQKYSSSHLLKPGPNTIRIPVKDISKAFGRLPEHKSLHFNIPAGGGRKYYIDFLRMVRHDGSNQ